jgi:hypothetical protein
LLGALLLPVQLRAQETALVTVPALTPVTVRLEETISSNKNKPGERFRITVAEDVMVGDAVVIPAGSTGEGEVVHASKSGAGGKAGELILVARHVIAGDQQIRLRSFALGALGKDNTENALATGIVLGPFGMLVRGGVITVPSGTVGTAKTALEFRLPVQSIKGGDDESKGD